MHKTQVHTHLASLHSAPVEHGRYIEKGKPELDENVIQRLEPWDKALRINLGVSVHLHASHNSGITSCQDAKLSQGIGLGP